MRERTKKQKRRADLLLIAALLALACGALLLRQAIRQPGSQAVVYVNGEPTAAYPLSEDIEVRLEAPDGESYNVLVIRDGRADVTEAGCPDGVCVRMHPIRYEGESITCLPNRTVIRIEGGEPSGVDIS